MKTACYTWPQFEIKINENINKKQNFNKNPFIYAILYGKDILSNENKDICISFVLIDCSIFLHENKVIKSRSQIVDGIIFELNISNNKIFLPRKELILHDPLLINIERFVCTCTFISIFRHVHDYFIIFYVLCVCFVLYYEYIYLNGILWQLLCLLFVTKLFYLYLHNFHRTQFFVQ